MTYIIERKMSIFFFFFKLKCQNVSLFEKTQPGPYPAYLLLSLCELFQLHKLVRTLYLMSSFERLPQDQCCPHFTDGKWKTQRSTSDLQHLQRASYALRIQGIRQRAVCSLRAKEQYRSFRTGKEDTGSTQRRFNKVCLQFRQCFSSFEI